MTETCSSSSNHYGSLFSILVHILHVVLLHKFLSIAYFQLFLFHMYTCDESILKSLHSLTLLHLLLRCANDSTEWSPLQINTTGITVDTHIDQNQLESQVIFGHLENTLAVRCLARNELVAVSREIKLVANGELLHCTLALIVG